MHPKYTEKTDNSFLRGKQFTKYHEPIKKPYHCIRRLYDNMTEKL